MITNKNINQIRRTNIGKDRYYYFLDEAKNLVKLPSVTTIIDRVIPKDEYLIKWIAKLGYEEAKEYTKQAADYGTFFDGIAKDFCKGKTFTRKMLNDMIEEFVYNNKINYDYKSWHKRIIEDILSLNQFIIDKHFELISDSFMLASQKLGYAGEIDAIGYISIGSGVNGRILKNDEKDGKIQKLLCILDFKSGRHGFYKTNLIQLSMYEELFKEYDTEIINNENKYCLCNFAPKSWRTKPTYYFKIWNDTQKHLLTAYKDIFYSDYFVINETIKENTDIVLEIGTEFEQLTVKKDLNEKLRNSLLDGFEIEEIEIENEEESENE